MKTNAIASCFHLFRVRQLASAGEFLALATLVTGLGAVPAHGATLNWSGAGDAELLWSTPGNWSPAGPPGAGDLAFFRDDGATNGSGVFFANNVLAVSTTVANLTFGNTNGFHNTLLQPGVTLTVSNNATGNAVFTGTGTDNGNAQIVTATVSGDGAALVVVATNTGSAFNVRQGTTTSGGSKRATLDLSGLDIFDLTAGRLLVAGDGSGTAAFNRPNGTLILARTNTLRLNGTAPAINVGDGSSNGGTEFVELGQTNAVFADSMTIARQKCVSTFRFNGLFAGSNPALYLRGAAGERVTTLALGDNSAQSTSGVASTGTIDLSGGTVDARVGTSYLGRGMNGTGTGQATGTLTFDAGVFDVNTMYLGYVNINTAVATVTGTVNVNNTATLIVNNRLEMGRNPGAAAQANATLNVAGGAVRANTITTTNGSVIGMINVSGGTLAVTNFAGTPEVPLNSLNIGDSVIELSPQDSVTNIVVTMLTTLSTTNNTISIRSLPVILEYPAQFPLISYATAGTYDFVLGTLPPGSPSFQGYLSNNVDQARIDLVITGGPPPPQPLTWNGNAGGDWDLSTANWLVGGLPGVFRQIDDATFDDSASGTTIVNLTTALAPHTLTVSNLTKTYTFTGTGGLSGSTGLNKQGAGTLVLANSGVNDFAGGAVIGGGKLQLGGRADLLPTNSTVTLGDAADAELDLNGWNQTIGALSGGGAGGGLVTLGSSTLAIAPGGGTYAGVISGSGGMAKTGPGIQVLSGANLYAGGTLVTGGRLSVANETGSGTGSGFVQVETNATFAIGAGGPGGSVAASFITNYGTVRLDRSDDFTLANVIVGWGGVSKVNTNTVLVPISNTYTGVTTISDGALRVSHPQALGDGVGQTSIPNAPEARLELTGDITLSEAILFAQKQSAAGLAPGIVNVSGTNTLAGPINANAGGSYWTFRTDAGKLIVSGVFSNLTTTGNRYVRLFGEAEGDWQTDYANNASGTAVNFLEKSDGGTWTLSGNNTYNGPTTITGGRLLVNGRIQNSSSVAVTGGALGGNGVINAPVTVEVAGTLAPGTSIGTLTINNTLALSGTTEMEVSHTAADKVQGLASVILGGTLKVVVVGPLTGTESFKLFAAAPGGYSGDFFYDLPPLDAPLAWDTSSMAVDGTLRVTGGVEPPEIGTAARTGDGNFQLSGTGPGDAAYRILATTNVALPLADWVQLTSGSFSGGAFAFTDLSATNYPRRFYSVVTP
jgi:fibronectin-binding autotransporter adhesin